MIVSNQEIDKRKWGLLVKDLKVAWNCRVMFILFNARCVKLLVSWQWYLMVSNEIRPISYWGDNWGTCTTFLLMPKWVVTSAELMSTCWNKKSHGRRNWSHDIYHDVLLYFTVNSVANCRLLQDDLQCTIAWSQKHNTSTYAIVEITQGYYSNWEPCSICMAYCMQQIYQSNKIWNSWTNALNNEPFSIH